MCPDKLSASFCCAALLLICLLPRLTSSMLLRVFSASCSFVLLFSSSSVHLPIPQSSGIPPIPTQCTPALSLSLSPSYLPLSPLHLTSSKPEHPSSFSWIILVHFFPLSLPLHPLVSPPHPFHLFLPCPSLLSSCQKLAGSAPLTIQPLTIQKHPGQRPRHRR